MASSSFLAENQSFSEANSSWASLVIDQVQNSFEDEDYSSILDFDSDVGGRSASVETHGRSKQYVDMKTFEQILQVMVQQGAALDNLRAELDQLRQERRQELEHRDARLRLAEKEIRSLRTDKEKAVASSDALYAECAALKASGKEQASSELLSVDEHNRIILRIKDDARARIENIEAEKSYLTLQLTRLQIQVAQLRNQVDDRSYPEEVLEELTKKLQHTIIESCQNADVEAQSVKQALAAAEERLSTFERELDSASSARVNAEDRCTHIEREYEELHAAHEIVQERLAILESTQGHPDETALREVQEQTEQIRMQLSEVEKARDVALMDCEQLRTLLKEAEERRSALASEVQYASGALEQVKERLSELQKERDTALTDSKHLRSTMKELEEKHAALSTEAEKNKQDLEVAEEQRGRAGRISKEVENELRIAKEQNDELSKAFVQEQENSKAAALHRHELESKIQSLKTSHAEELFVKDNTVSEATSKIELLQVKLDEETQRSSALGIELAETSKLLAERTDSASSELKEAHASFRVADEGRVQAEGRLKEVGENLQVAEKERFELEAQLKQVQDALSSASKRQSEVESELQQVIQSKETELKEAKQNLQAEVDRLNALLMDASAEITDGNKFRSDLAEAGEKEKKEHLKELKRLESDLKAFKEQVASSEALADRNQAEVRARQEQIDQLEEALKEAKKGRNEALRENERIRLLYAEAEGNRAEADMNNEELEQKISELEEEVKKMPALESDLKNSRAQLAGAIETMNVAKDQTAKCLVETLQSRTEIAELRAENEQLIAARRQMAAIYGLPSETTFSPRRTPTRLVPSVPVPRSSLSLSPSTSSAAPQLIEPSGPPAKRRRVSKLSLATNNSAGVMSGGVAAGSSTDSAIFLEDTDGRFFASPSTPTSQRHNGTNEEVPKHVFDIYVAFAKVASWDDAENRPVCGFCTLHNHRIDKAQHPPLDFDPSLYPTMFWNHCLSVHKVVLRPDIEAWLKAEGLKPFPSESLASADLPTVFANFVSWKKSEANHVCGLCELENTHDDREPRPMLDFDPSVDPILFWTHCHKDHVPFWKPVY